MSSVKNKNLHICIAEKINYSRDMDKISPINLRKEVQYYAN